MNVKMLLHCGLQTWKYIMILTLAANMCLLYTYFSKQRCSVHILCVLLNTTYSKSPTIKNKGQSTSRDAASVILGTFPGHMFSTQVSTKISHFQLLPHHQKTVVLGVLTRMTKNFCYFTNQSINPQEYGCLATMPRGLCQNENKFNLHQ